MSVITSGWAAPFISELSSKVNKKRSEKNIQSTRHRASTSNFYQRQRSDSSAELGGICTNIYPVVLLQSVEHVLPGTLRTLKESIPAESRGKKRLVTSDKCRTLKRQKVCNTHVTDEHLDELSGDTMLLDSYLKFL